jgi:hypothetical protein
MQLGDWRGKTRELFRRFVRDLPFIVGGWLVVAVGVAVYGYLQGEPLSDAVRTALVFLPMAIPLSPLIWLSRARAKARTPSALPAIGLGCLWSAVTLPLAVALVVALANVLGAE